MAGVKGRSGRRKFVATAADLVLPELGDTEDSIRAYCAAVAKAVERGQLDPRTADSIGSLAKTALSALRQKEQRTDLEELKAMYEAAKSLQLAGVEREVAERQHLDEK